MLQKSRTCVGVGWEDEGKVIISEWGLLHFKSDVPRETVLLEAGRCTQKGWHDLGSICYL